MEQSLDLGVKSSWKDIWSSFDSASTARIVGYVAIGAAAFKAMDLYKTWALEEKARQNLYNTQTQTTAFAMTMGTMAGLTTIATAALGAISFLVAAVAVTSTAVLVVGVAALGGVINRQFIPNNYGSMGSQTGKVLGLF